MFTNTNTMRLILNIFTIFLRISVVCTLTVFLASCASQKAGSSADSDAEPLSCVAVLATDTVYDDAAKAKPLQHGAQFLYGEIISELESSQVAQVIEVAGLLDQISEVSGGRMGAIKEIGHRSQCGAVLMSTLTDFSQRQGGQYAVDSPASAAFELQLLEASTAKTLWTSNFSETQTSLMSNLFSFGKAAKRGFKWITVEDLVAQGVHEKLVECPYFY